MVWCTPRAKKFEWFSLIIGELLFPKNFWDAPIWGGSGGSVPQIVAPIKAITNNFIEASLSCIGWEVLNGVGVDGVGGIFPFFVRISSLFSYSHRGQGQTTAIYCKNGEFHSDPVCTDPVQNFPNWENKLENFAKNFAKNFAPDCHPVETRTSPKTSLHRKPLLTQMWHSGHFRILGRR